MAFQSLQTLSLASLVHDALIALGFGVALLAGLAFFSLGLLLPGLLTSLGGHFGASGAGYVEFGPAAAPLISEPAPRRGPSSADNPAPQPVERADVDVARVVQDDAVDAVELTFTTP